MAEFKYKDYTPEESRIYDEALAKIRKAIENGLSLSEACSMVDVEDAGLKRFIEDDAVKVIIAEMHYGKSVPLTQIADILKVSLKRLNKANMEMLEEIGITAAEMIKQNKPHGHVGNA